MSDRRGDSLVTDASFSPTGNLILTTSRDRSVRIWDGLTGQALRVLPVDPEELRDAQFNLSEDRILTDTYSPEEATHSARLWDVSTGAEVANLKFENEGLLSVSFSPNSDRVVTTSKAYNSSQKFVRLWDSKTGKLVKEIAALAAEKPRLNFGTGLNWKLTSHGLLKLFGNGITDEQTSAEL